MKRFALLGGIATALSIKGWGVPHILWQEFALFTCISSSLGMILFWNGLIAIYNKLGAIIVNLVTFIALFWIHFPFGLFD